MGQVVISGLSMGMIYGLIACGFSLVFRMTRVVNFAAGDIVMLGGMIGYTAYVIWGVSIWVAMLLSALGTGLLLMVVERVALAPVYRKGILPAVVATIGLSLVMQNGAQIVWGRGGFSFPTVFGNDPVTVLGIRIVPELLVIFVIGSIVMALLTLFLTRTRIGVATRATAGDRQAALLVGIPDRAINSLSFFIAGVLAAIAGVLIAPVTFLTATMGLALGLKGFVAAIVGGLGSLPGAIVGGLILGITEISIGAYVDANYREGIAFALMVLVLIIRPRGLFGEEGTEEER
jgi:branched-chain amino acid transport system permease protein